MTIEEFEMYLQASKDKFKPKAFNRMLEKIKYEDIPNLIDLRIKTLFEQELSNYLVKDNN